ncbi:MAG: leucine-rich repeat domain-containing protein [Bacteroidales bacterium]|nr:leucine-rich repeat domain-containing protein [Bacteroidales bacterium]
METQNLQNSPQQIVDPLFLKSEKEIITEYINRELVKNNMDLKKDSLKHIERKKLIAVSISTAISFILIVLFRVFHYSNYSAGFLVILNIVFVLKVFCKASAADFFYKQVIGRPDENISDIIAPQLYDKCKNQSVLRFLIIIGGVFVIPFLLFMNSHVLYEDGPNGKYVRFYTSGVIGDNQVIIPDEVDGVKVVGIRGDVFRNSSITKIQLPESIDTIRGHAFENCEELSYINFPKNLRYIGASAFYGCCLLKEVNIGENVKYIGHSAFEFCSSANFSFSENLVLDSIASRAFYYCRNLGGSFRIPKGITEIKSQAFYSTSITEVIIPEEITRIGGYAFCDCYDLKNVIFEGNSSLNRIGGHAFEDCFELTEITLPPSLKEIGSSAFRSCDALRIVKVPKDCQINDKAFKNSPNVEIVKY